MRIGLTATVRRLLTSMKRSTPKLDRNTLASFVDQFLNDRDRFLKIAGRSGSPAYLLDSKKVVERARQFKDEFARVHSKTRVYYAVKSNNCPEVARLVTEAGLGLDVSSGKELLMALKTSAAEIIFSGPGKTDEELQLAADHSRRVVVLLDSFRELSRLDHFASHSNTTVRAGVRLTTDEGSIWRKFGIPLSELKKFMVEADRCKYVDLRGIQFHLSWNLKADPYVKFIARLGAELRRMTISQRHSLRFIDIGGGFWPETGEWLQEAATPEGKLRALVTDKPKPKSAHFHLKAWRLEEFVDHIRAALVKDLPSDMTCTICAEPGRWISNEAMHLLLRVVDRKGVDLVITDGGTNAVGWDKFESDYCPIINLTRPENSEKDCLVCGSLCTPHDIWGYSYFGSDIQPGDLLLIPNQGAYTFSLSQEFIKSIPGVVEMGNFEYIKNENSVDKIEEIIKHK